MAVPSEFQDLDEDWGSDEGELEEEVIEDDSTDWRQQLHGLDMQLRFVVQADGALVPLSPRSRSPSVGLSDDEADDAELEPGRAEVARAGGGSLGAGGSGTVRVGRRGRGGRGGRGRCSGGSVRARGEGLVERFATDEDLPAPLREECERLTSARHRRARVVRERSAANLAAEECDRDGLDEEGGEEYEDDDVFVWTPMDGWNGVKETFLPEASGPTRPFVDAYDAFRSYWDDSLLSHIVEETNRHAREIRSERFQRVWFDTNLDELLILFAFWMMLGIIKMPTVKSCFSSLTILRTEIFRSMFTQDRYWNMNRAFHLANGSRDANDPDNVLYPMGPVIDQLNLKFKQNYRLQQDICIDESLTLWKGPLGFKQFIKTKAARFGIKSYELCESSTGYLWSFFIYIGRRTHTSTGPVSVATVVRLVEPLLDLGHVLYMDNWFNSPKLARFLKRRRTDCVGTLRASRVDVPVAVQRAPLAEGEFVARQCGDVMVVTLHDRKWITCISTFHDVTQVCKPARSGRPAQFKLNLIEDYNHGIGGVDRLDQMLESYLIERKQCQAWTKKLFKRLLNVTIQNARVLLEKSSGAKVEALPFRLALVQAILDRHLGKVPLRTPGKPRPDPRVNYQQFPAARLTERHFIRRIPITDEMRAAVKHRPNQGRRQCAWCSANGRKRSKTVYECSQCKVALCLDTCFEQFHTIP